MAKKHKPMPLFLCQMAVVGIVMLAVFSYAGSRFSFGLESQEAASCLPYSYYIIDKHNTAIPAAGSYVAFQLDQRAEPWFPEGSIFIKKVMAVPGDQVAVDNAVVWISGEGSDVAVLDPSVLEKLGKTYDQLNRSYELESDQLWVMGTADNSFDSRYWGPIDQPMVIGRVYPIY